MADRILIVDDEERIRKLLTMYLEREGYIVDEASDGFIGLEKIKNIDYSCVLLDVHLPKLNGTKILREVRTVKATPIVIISAKGDEQSRVDGFEMGADDYIIKPFSPREVVLRVKAILQRTKRSVFYIPEFSVKDVLVFNDLIVDINAHKVIVDGNDITLTPKEFDLLIFLCKSPDRVHSRSELLKAVWNYNSYGDLRTVDTHIKRIRKKIDEKSENASKMIVTVWGKGYMFDASKN
ncbi:response regulator transcription factor [Gemelliphila palaticanis]|uniref:Response regulator transcription factor n=1 Tax=Gemelliphila palaticanis TaxID=81950 RepID=A0ABX2SY10_9BACL|nr:response regulator transcription factor [Gemella palaticanis]MBF0715250.1 response regulator transcription factor [Gemella palaticanis]NYS47180.1 response regulator transcription factor [Gemella palaticanis]